jgi:uncharacterized protein YjdB
VIQQGSFSAKDETIIQEGSVGNKYFGDISLNTAHIMGSTQGIENGIGSQFDYPLPWNSPKNAAEQWDFSTLAALYMDPLNYSYFTSQSWLGPLYNKIKQFVLDGGTIYITADSNLFAQNLASAAGVGIQFYTKTQVPVYYGIAGLNKIILKGSLKEAVGVDELVIPFMPYEDGSGGPVFRDIGSATPLAAAEIVLSNGTLMRYPVAVSFPLGKGTVYYSSFPIPSNLDTVTYGLTEADMPAVREFAKWFMSKPLANADRVRAANAHGIDNADISQREDTTVDKAKSKGLPADLTVSEDITVIAAISETVLGKVDYSTIPVDYADNRLWTASLITPNGEIFATKTTSGDILAFPVEAKDNTGGTWRVKIDNATGFLDKQLFFTMVVKGLRDIGGGTPTDPNNPIIPVAGVTLLPTSADLTVGSTVQLTPTIIPSNATSQDVAWSTSDPDIASVNTTGEVTAHAVGTTTITATTVDGGHTAESLITVTTVSTPVPVTGILLNPTTLQLTEVEQRSLSVIFTPADATNRNVTWSTSNSSVATVVNGTVTAKGKGTATITATTEDGSKTAACTVTVTENGGGGSDDPKQQYYENKYPGKNVLIAPEGGGQVDGADGDDVIVSGNGADWLEGGEGNDTYIYEAGSGDDVISNASNGEGDQDELHFGPGIWKEDLVFAREDNDQIIRVLDGTGGYAGSVTIEDWYLDEKNKLSKIVFEDETELTTEEIEDLAANSAVILRGTTGANTLRARSAGSSRTIVYGLAGGDTLYGSANEDILTGGPGNDTIRARSNQSNEGGGKKVFVWTPGDGNDTIHYYREFFIFLYYKFNFSF